MVRPKDWERIYFEDQKINSLKIKLASSGKCSFLAYSIITIRIIWFVWLHIVGDFRYNVVIFGGLRRYQDPTLQLFWGRKHCCFQVLAFRMKQKVFKCITNHLIKAPPSSSYSDYWFDESAIISNEICKRLITWAALAWSSGVRWSSRVTTTG